MKKEERLKLIKKEERQKQEGRHKKGKLLFSANNNYDVTNRTLLQ